MILFRIFNLPSFLKFKQLLFNPHFFQMQVRVYKDGSKTAWVTFSKNPGTNDNWFHTSRVRNCHPWSKARLKATSTVMDKGLPSENMYWLISEGFKNSNQPIGTRTPHAHWLVIKGRDACDMAPNVAMPAILYSKKTTATYLATHGNQFIISVAFISSSLNSCNYVCYIMANLKRLPPWKLSPFHV